MNNTSCTYYAELGGKLKKSKDFPAQQITRNSESIYVVPDFFNSIAETMTLGAANYKITTTTIKEVPD